MKPNPLRAGPHFGVEDDVLWRGIAELASDLFGDLSFGIDDQSHGVASGADGIFEFIVEVTSQLGEHANCLTQLQLVLVHLDPCRLESHHDFLLY